MSHAAIAQYLGLMESLATRAGPSAPASLRSRSGLMMEFGKAFEIGPESFKAKKGPPKMCFMNAGRMALDDDGLTYVEGYVAVGGFPIDHAWVVKKGSNVVIEPTLRQEPGEEGLYGGYFGIPFKTRYLRSVLLKTRYWGLISITNRDLFNANKVKPEEFLEVAS